MEMIYMGLGLVLLIFTMLGLWLYSSKKHKARQEQVKEISYLLDRLAEAAIKRKTQLYESLDAADSPALTALMTAAETSPVDITQELKEMESLWHELSQQLVEFSNQSVQATLQSSVVTTRAAQTANKITKLVEATKNKLHA